MCRKTRRQGAQKSLNRAQGAAAGQVARPALNTEGWRPYRPGRPPTSPSPGFVSINHRSIVHRSLGLVFHTSDHPATESSDIALAGRTHVTPVDVMDLPSTIYCTSSRHVARNAANRKHSRRGALYRLHGPRPETSCMYSGALRNTTECPLRRTFVARRCRPSQAIRGWPNDGMACLDSHSAVWACLILLAKGSALNVVGGCAGLPTAKGVKDRSLSIRYKLFGVGQQLRKDPETSYGVWSTKMTNSLNGAA